MRRETYYVSQWDLITCRVLVQSPETVRYICDEDEHGNILALHAQHPTKFILEDK